MHHALLELKHRRAVQTTDSDRARAVEVHRWSQGTAPAEGDPGWRAGIEASIRHLEAMARKPRDLWRPAYFAAVDEALVHLRAMLERGTERGTTPVCGTPG